MVYQWFDLKTTMTICQWFGLKITGMFSPILTLKPVVTVYFGLTSKSMDSGFSVWTSKPTAPV
jgi:hypothetical protein